MTTFNKLTFDILRYWNIIFYFQYAIWCFWKCFDKIFKINTRNETYLFCLDYIFLMNNNNQNIDVAPTNNNQDRVDDEPLTPIVSDEDNNQDINEDELFYEEIDDEPLTPIVNDEDKPDPDFLTRAYALQLEKAQRRHNLKFLKKIKQWEFEQKLRDAQDKKIKQQIEKLINQQKLEQKLKNAKKEQIKQRIQKLIHEGKTQDQDGVDQGFQFVKISISHLKKWFGLFLNSFTSLYYLMPLHHWIIYLLLLAFLYLLICYFWKKLFKDGRKTYSYLISWKKFSLFLMLNFTINWALNLYYMNYTKTVFCGILSTYPIIVLLVLFSLWFLWIYAIYELNHKNIEQEKNKQNKQNKQKKI